MMYFCEKCKQSIQNHTDGLVLKIRDESNNFIKAFILHKGDCDEVVSGHYRSQGMNANATMTLDTLHNLNAVEKYRVTGEM